MIKIALKKPLSPGDHLKVPIFRQIDPLRRQNKEKHRLTEGITIRQRRRFVRRRRVRHRGRNEPQLRPSVLPQGPQERYRRHFRRRPAGTSRQYKFRRTRRILPTPGDTSR